MRVSGSTFDVSAGGLCGCGSTPQPQTLIVFAPMIPASMPSPSYTVSAGPCRAAASGSERCIMFPGREGYQKKKVVAAKTHVDDLDTGTCADSLANVMA